MRLSARVSLARTLFVGAAVAGIFLVLPASGSATKKFGAKLKNPDGSVTQPANANVNGHSCKQSDTDLSNDPCSRVAVRFGDTGAIQGHVKAPRDGRLKKIKIVAAGPGTFTPYLARVKDLNVGSRTGKAKAKHKGDQITYTGDNNAPYTIETFPYHVRVNKGDYLAVKSKRTSFLKCQTGSLEQLLFQPPLVPGDPFKPSNGDDDCTLLIQAIYR